MSARWLSYFSPHQRGRDGPPRSGPGAPASGGPRTPAGRGEMNRLDRALALLLLLRDGRVWSAADLARRLEVSRRTVYRDMETLSAIGVPVYAEMGRAGGFRLLQGYFLPPVMFSVDEAVSLLLAVTLLRSLRARPFAAELEMGERKLLAAMPDALRAVLADARKVIGFEGAPGDIFHPERPDPGLTGAADDVAAARPAEDQVLGGV